MGDWDEDGYPLHGERLKFYCFKCDTGFFTAGAYHAHKPCPALPVGDEQTGGES